LKRGSKGSRSTFVTSMYNAHHARRATPTTMDGRVAWIPNSASARNSGAFDALAPVEPSDDALADRAALAAAAQARYELWSAENTESQGASSALGLHPSKHTFRDRHIEKELHGLMSFRIGPRTERERIAAARAEHRILKRPVFENPGSNTMGMVFSYQRRGYLLRQRMKSLEVGGPMRFNALTESERIMDSKHRAAVHHVPLEQSAEELRERADQVAMYRRANKARWVAERDFHRGPRALREPFAPFASLAIEPYREIPDHDTYGLLNFGHTRVRDTRLEVRAAPRRALVALCRLRRERRRVAPSRAPVAHPASLPLAPAADGPCGLQKRGAFRRIPGQHDEIVHVERAAGALAERAQNLLSRGRVRSRERGDALSLKLISSRQPDRKARPSLTLIRPAPS